MTLLSTTATSLSSCLELPARTWVEVDLAALRHNGLAAQAALANLALGVIAVVKSDGYGLGMVPVAQAIEDLVRAFAVANVTEARTLRRAGISRPIYLLGPALPEEWAAVVEGGFCPAVSCQEEALGYAAEAARQQVVLAVHVVIDTGMGRIGALPEEAEPLLQKVIENPHLSLDSTASHFPSADEDSDYTTAQLERFLELVRALKMKGLSIDQTQVANSAGLISTPPLTGSWARVGLLLYGVSPLAAAQPRLRSVATWKTRVTLVKNLPAGHGISYGRTYITARPSRVATLSVGYADGYPRQASGQGAEVLLAGRRCPVLGRVTMDQLMVDTTDLPTRPQVGDEAVLVGPQGQEEITAEELAAKGGTIVWDLFTGLGPRVRRCYLPFSR